jgi:hypothetical protein
VKPGAATVEANAHLVTGGEFEDIRGRIVSKYGVMTKFTRLLGTLAGVLRGKRTPYGDHDLVITPTSAA